jgi:hypothetical protein
LTINGTTQDVVYVAAEANNIYAISASGPGLVKILVQRKLGVPVQDPGLFTTVSSNGQKPGTAIIWAVGRPNDSNPANATLYGFDPTAATGSPASGALVKCRHDGRRCGGAKRPASHRTCRPRVRFAR